MNNNTNPMEPGYNRPGVIISRSEALFNKAVFTSDEFIEDADLETQKKRQQKINDINAVIERRKNTFDLV
jgi:hypothetical protein